MIAVLHATADCISKPDWRRLPLLVETLVAKTSFPSRALRRVVTFGLVAAAAVACASTTASAQINFVGVTSYAFNGGVLAATATVNGLTVTRDGFNVTTTPFFGNISQAAIGGVGNNLGRISLTGQPFFYVNVPFQLQLAFTTPTAGSQQFFASVRGSVNGSTVGGVTFRFNPSVITNIPFTNGPGSGTFDLSVNNVSVNAGQSNAQLTGDITATAATVAPEAGTSVLLADRKSVV